MIERLEQYLIHRIEMKEKEIIESQGEITGLQEALTSLRQFRKQENS